MFKNALVSVSDKSGLVEFLKPLAEQGLRIVSTGGTARHLKEAGLTVVDVAEQTGFQEVMNGRVKTLHPNVHMCLLARNFVADDIEALKANDLEPFDLVIGSLYPFEESLKKGLGERDQVEFIDIGGPSFLRAAAKSYERITVITDTADYDWIGSKGETTVEDRRLLASKVFGHVSAYDSLIADYLRGGDITEGADYAKGGRFHQALRYGENPQQKAAWYKSLGSKGGLHDARVLQGKALSYNNVLDLDAAVSTLAEFSGEKACVSLKHNNPCGVAVGKEPVEVLKASLAADPVSVFGGIIAVNFEVDKACAEELSKLFLECIVAPSFSSEALEHMGKKKNLRLLQWPGLMELDQEYKVRSILGGFLLQGADQVAKTWPKDWRLLGEEPLEEVRSSIMLAWKTCAHLKSNAIALSAEGQSLGLGMGQVNRVDAVDQAVQRMRKFHDGKKDIVMASDAFFPFPDSIDLAAEAGVKWVVQPGGSIKDEEVISRAKELGITLILTGVRHFLH